MWLTRAINELDLDSASKFQNSRYYYLLLGMKADDAIVPDTFIFMYSLTDNSYNPNLYKTLYIPTLPSLYVDNYLTWCFRNHI